MWTRTLGHLGANLPVKIRQTGISAVGSKSSTPMTGTKCGTNGTADLPRLIRLNVNTGYGILMAAGTGSWSALFHCMARREPASGGWA